MLNLMEECFEEDPSDRLADAAVLAERLETLLRTERAEEAVGTTISPSVSPPVVDPPVNLPAIPILAVPLT